MKIVKPSYQVFDLYNSDQNLKTIEAVGRTCYKSEDKITDDSCTQFVSGIIKRGHEAVIEHRSFIFELNISSYLKLMGVLLTLEKRGFNSFIRVTVEDRHVVSANIRAWRDFFRACLDNNVTIPDFTWKFIHENDILFPEFKNLTNNINVDPHNLFKPLTILDLHAGIEQLTHTDVSVRLTNDRGVSHEEVRHRVASFAQESTRYCNYAKDKFGNEITYIDLKGSMELDKKVNALPEEVQAEIYDEWVCACIDAEQHYNRMIELGATPQIARAVLNNSTKTEICITMSLAYWRHFFDLRCSPAAHPAMREIALMLLGEFKTMFPGVFDDFGKEELT